MRRGRRAAGQGDAVVGDAGGLSDARHRRAAARAARRRGARGVHPWVRLLRHQRRGHRDLRCRAALAGGRPAGARAAHAPRRDGVGELRQRVRDRSARRARRRGHDRRLGLRGVVAGARRAARLRQPRQRRHRLAGRVRAGRGGAAHAGPRAHDAAQQRPEHGAVVRHRVRRRRLSRNRNRAERARAVAPRRVAVLHRPAARARALSEHVRARVVHGRARRGRQGGPGGVPAAAPAATSGCARSVRSAAMAARSGRRGRRRVGQRARPAPRSGRGISCVLYEGDNGYVAIVAEVEVDRDQRRDHRRAARRRAGLRPDLESGRREEPVRRRRAARHEPRALRRGHVDRPAR